MTSLRRATGLAQSGLFEFMQNSHASKDAALPHVFVDGGEDPDAAEDDGGGAAPEPDHALLAGRPQVHAEDAGNHRAQRRREAADAERQLQPVDLRDARHTYIGRRDTRENPA